MQEENKKELSMKVIGNRKMPTINLEKMNNFLKLVIELRKGRPFIPKGVYRFKTFEDCEKWTMKMLTRR